MNKAKIQTDGTLLYLPNTYANWDNFQNASKELQESYGFYEVVNPILEEGKMNGTPYFDDVNKVITFNVVDAPPAPPIPEMPINIDTRAINTAIGKYFIPKYGIDFQMYFPMIMNNLKDAPVPMYKANMENLREFSLMYLADGKIDQTDLTAFEQIFLDNGFDLNDYPRLTQ